MSSITLLSRILGMLRDVLIAFVFGASIASDAFFIAFRPFDLIRKMMADGILTLSFVPIFSRILAKRGRAEAVSMFLSACFIVSVSAAAVAALGIYLAPMVIQVLAPGYLNGSYAQTLSILMLKIMMPYMVVLFIVALSMGGLNCLGNFWVPAATPVLLNLCVIVVTVFLADRFSPPVSVLAAGVTLGGGIQLGFQIPWLRRAGMLDFQRFRIYHWGVAKMMKRLIPSVIGAAAVQVNMLVAGLLASTLAPGAVSSLYYAERLVQFPLALFAASVATVLLPMLSGRAAVQGLSGIGPGFGVGVTLVLFLIIPAMAGMMALSRPIVAILFERGAFDAAAAVQTADCLFWLCTGLWAMAGTRLFVTFHFALSNSRLPFLAGLFSIGCNLILGVVFGRVMGITGLALSVAMSAMAGFIFLAWRSPVEAGLKSVMVSACRAVFISGIMISLVHWTWRVCSDWMPMTIWGKCIGLGVAIGAGVSFFFAVAAMVAKEEVKLFKQVIFSKR